MAAFFRALQAFLRLGVFRTPAFAVDRGSVGAFFAAFALHAVTVIAWQWTYVVGTPVLFVHGLPSLAADGLVALMLAALIARAWHRDALLWPLATQLVLLLWIARALPFFFAAFGWQAPPLYHEPIAMPLVAGLSAWALVVMRRFFDWTDPFRPWARRTSAALTMALGIGAMLSAFPSTPIVTPDWDAEADAAEAPANGPPFDAEALMSTQVARVDAALRDVRPGTPGEIDLFVVAFGGDGDERVFANEVRHVERLFARRFGAAGRIVPLINDRRAPEDAPLATRTNLRHALTGIAQRMDRDEDILLVFVTSHGFEDHAIHVALDQLPLNRITPADLATAIGDAGVRHRAVIVSACYSGGFVPALKADDALVITAARHDRTSFGCGADSEITYFGRALLDEALNETGDLIEAFERAARSVATREAREGIDASYPQLEGGGTFVAQWRRRLAAHPPGEPVPFAPIAAPAAPAAPSP